MIRCRIARRFVDAVLERELELEERFQLEEHTRSCRACTEYEARARSLQELLEGPGDPPPTAPDVEAAARAVFARLDGGDGSARRPPFSPGRRARRGALLAGALLGGALTLVSASAFLLLRDGGDPTPGALLPPAIVESRDESTDWTPARVEVAVRGTLLESFGVLGADEERALARFHAGTREAARAGWPVRRFVEGLLDCPDAAVALAAARCLATLGEAGAVPALQRTLSRTVCSHTTGAELADGVLDALGALGEPAVIALERALDEPGLAPRAVLQICRIGGPRAAAVLERAARSAREDSNPSRAALLDALTTTGPAAVPGLLRLAAEQEGGETTAILARLPLVSGGGPELARVLARERLPGDLAYRALFFLRPAEALPWLEERCATHRERALALETLASFPDTGPLSSVLRLARGGRVPREDVGRLLVALLERDDERAESFTRELLARPDTDPGMSEGARSWLELLIESGHAGAARALVPLVFSESLEPDDRQWAALAVGELGTADDAERLLRALGEHATGDRRCTAACLLSIHAKLGPQGVERLLAPCSGTNVRRVLAALEGEGSGEAVLVHRVARALDGALAELAGSSAEQEDTL